MKKIKRFFLKWKIKRRFKKYNLASGNNLDAIGFAYGLSRILYKEMCDASYEYEMVSVTGMKSGYSENDEYYKKRIIDSIRGRK